MCLTVHTTEWEFMMSPFLIALFLGLAAAVIDTVPMILRKLDTMFILSAAVFWIVFGFLLPRFNLFAMPWMNGLVLAAALILPLLPMIYRLDRPALPMIIGTSVILSAAAGFAYGRLV